MSPAPTLSRFTPSVMDRELLERLFVARQRVLDEVVRRVEAASTSTERNHTLLVGPRGAGKTHLVSLVAHRVRDLVGEGTGVQLAWLPEDPWTLVSYRHLLAAVAARLEPRVAHEVPGTEEDLERLLEGRAAERGPVVVVVENLDQILRAIGDDGQQRLRHLLQSSRPLLLVATSTTLDRSLTDQASPFYGFFTTSRLEPFDVDQAAEMLTAIAREREDEALVAYLASPEGWSRLRTVEHLAGGQPRMWAALASALTVEGLDDLVDLLLTRFDDLTPYYQEQLARLSGHQRLVVAELAALDRPLAVKELAERLEIDQRSVAKTVSDLVERRWVAETTSPVVAMLDRRRTYYELAEPLARLAFQIKDNRGEPLRLVVDFLKHWFDPEDLSEVKALDHVRQFTASVEAYLRAASAAQRSDGVVAATRRLSGLPASEGEALTILAEVDDALDALGRGVAEPFLDLPAPVRRALEVQLADQSVSSVRLRVHELALGEVERGLTVLAVPWVERASTLLAQDDAHLWRSQAVLARWSGRSGRIGEALANLWALRAVESVEEAVAALRALGDLTVALIESGRCQEASELTSKILALSNLWTGSDHQAESRREIETSRAHFEWLERHIAGYLESPGLVELAVDGLPETLPVCQAMTQVLRGRAQVAKARALQSRVLDACEERWGPDDPHTVVAREMLASLG